MSAAPTPSTQDDVRNVGLVLGVLAVLAAFALSITAFLMAAGSGAEEAASTAAPVHVVLSELAITPGALTVEAGGSLHVVNEGNIAHNLTDLVLHG